MSIKTEWNKFINKIMWLWIWDSSTRKELRAPLSQLIYGKNNNIILLSTDDIPKEGRKASNITGLNIYIKGDNNTIKIADSKFLEHGKKQKYTVMFWIQENGENQDSEKDKDLKITLNVEAIQTIK